MRKRYANPVTRFQHDQRVARGYLIRAIKAGKTECSNMAMPLLGCTLLEFKAWIERQFTAGMSWDNYGYWELDEVTPVSAFNFNDSEQVAACYHFTNTRPQLKAQNRGYERRDYTADVRRALAQAASLEMAA